MKTLTKNILISLFTIIFSWIIFSTVNITYCYADEVKDSTLTDTEIIINDIKYNLNDSDNTAIVGDNRWRSEISGNIALPETINANGKQYTLVGFKPYAFSYCNELYAITIPDSVKNLSDHIFYNCNNLEHVKLPNGINKIPQYAFNNCCFLSSINVPESVRIIEYSAFYSCLRLKTFSIPKNLERIEEFALANCKDLESSLIIPASVNTIKSGAFELDSNIKKIKFLGSNPLTGENIFNDMDFDLYYQEGTYGWNPSDTTYQSAKHITYHMEKAYSYDGKIYFQYPRHNSVNVDLIVNGTLVESKKCPIENGCAKFNFDKILKDSKVQICIHLDRFDFYTDEFKIHSNVRNEFYV